MPKFKIEVWDGLHREYIIIERNAKDIESVEIDLEGGRYLINDIRQAKKGGKREGAGRKTTGREATKVVRIPASKDIDRLLAIEEDLKSLVEAWKKELHPTSPRDESARTIIEEIDKLLN